MRKKNLWKKAASVIIAAAMIMSAMPVYAATQEQPAEVVVQGTTDEETDDVVETELYVDDEENVGEASDPLQPLQDKTVEVSTAEELRDIIEDTNTTYTTDSANPKAKYKKLTINIEKNIDLSEIKERWISGYVNGYNGAELYTINGNNHIIKNLPGALFDRTWAGNGQLIINNLTIANSIMEGGDDDHGFGAFVGHTEATSKIELNNCNLLNCTLTGADWTGGLIGYAAGYNRQNDGPVPENIKITNCSVKNSIIEGAGSTGAFLGHATGNAWTYVTIQDCEAEENTIICTDDDSNKAGSVMGTVGVGEVTVNNVTVSRNTVSSNNVENKRIAGRFGSAGKLTILGGSYDCQKSEAMPLTYEGSTLAIDEENKPQFSAVAAIGDVHYDSLQDAIDSAEDGATIKVLEDIDVSTTISIDKNLIINLNGNTITGKDANGEGVRVFQIKNGNVRLTGSGTVQVVDSGIDEASSVIRVGDNGETGTPILTIDSDVKIYTNQCYGVTIFGSTTETLIVNGEITTTDVPAISGNGTDVYSGTTITLAEGSKVTTTNDYAIYHPQLGTLNINGKVEGKGGIEAKAGNTNVSVGASIKATTETEPSHAKNSNGTSTQGYAIAVVENSDYAGGAKVSIAGGTVTGKVSIEKDNDVEEGKKGSISITGGTFSEEPLKDYLAPKHYAHKGNVSGKWGVSTTDGHNYNYKNNGYDYFCICGDSVYIPPYTPPQPTTPPATTDTVTNPDGSTTSTTTQENTDGSTTTTVVDKDSNGNVTGTTETTEKTTGNTTTKTETATTVDGAQTVTETTTVKNQDGSTEETKKVTDKDANGNVTGTTETVEKTEGNTTTTKETTTAADGSQTVTESTLVKNEDGSSEEKATITAADGSVTNVTTTTQTDGSATEVKETSEKNDAGNTVDVTATTKTDSNGDVTSVKEQSVITNVADNTSATVNVLKDGEDNVKYSRATVNKTVDEDTTRVKLEGPVVDQIESASGTSNVTITMNVNTDDGDTKYSLKVATKNLQAGNKLYVYKENPETGERTMVNSLLYTVTEDGSVTFNTKQNANFVLVNKASAAALNKAIKKTLTAAKPSSSVKAGKKIKMALNPNLNMENVKSVKYSTTQSSVAKVSSNGTITAKKAGIVSIKAMITLKNGYIKTVTTKITVKE